jgi:hypothetical protein
MNAFVTLAEVARSLLHDKPRRRIIIPEVLPAGPSLMYGPSGVGKTGLAIRTAVAIGAGLLWADRPVSAGSVLYVAGEDIEGAKLRFVAAAHELGLDPGSLPIAIMEAPAEGLVANSARMAVVAAAKALSKQTTQVAAIMVDTLSASFGPKSQDDATAASEYMTNADRTARELECAFLSIHHTGKNENSGMRGSRVFFDRADAVVRVGKGKGDTTYAEVEKLRNGPSGARFAYDIDGIDVATAGGAINTQVIRQLRGLQPQAISSDDAKALRKQTIADQMLAALVRIGGVTGATVLAWQTACYELWSDKAPETKRKLFSNTKKRLQTDGLVSVQGENVTVTVTGDAQVTPLVTPQPENVTVTVTNPLSLEGGDSDRRPGGRKSNGVHPHGDGSDLSNKSASTGSVGRAKALHPGVRGGKSPQRQRAGDGDGMTQQHLSGGEDA